MDKTNIPDFYMAFSWFIKIAEFTSGKYLYYLRNNVQDILIRAHNYACSFACDNWICHWTGEIVLLVVQFIRKIVSLQVDHLTNFEPCWWSFRCCFSAAVEIDCPSGTYAMGQNTTCTKCPAGKKCPNVDGSSIDDCQPGQFSLAGMVTFDLVLKFARGEHFRCMFLLLWWNGKGLEDRLKYYENLIEGNSGKISLICHYNKEMQHFYNVTIEM